jgi:hypothetical protein
MHDLLHDLTKIQWRQYMTPAINYRPSLLIGRLRRVNVMGERAIWASKLYIEKMPIPPRLRQWLRRCLFVPGVKEVPVEKLLLGSQHNLTGSQFAERTEDLMWTSTPAANGPHAELLRLASLKPSSKLTDDEILESPYGMFTRRCVQVCGEFLGASESSQLIDVARAFIARSHGEPQLHQGFLGQSKDGEPIRVARIRHSDHYQILDGHHRVAAAAVAGVKSVPVCIRRLPTVTAIQGLLTGMSWIDGRRELYQPLPAPELSSAWTTVRRCSDRLEKMAEFLGHEDLLPPVTTSYLDVASCYGWFVNAMGDLGYECEGIELDPLARPLGEAAYGLRPSQITTGDCTEVMQNASRQWDVVSCFSLLHHFVLGKADATPMQLMELLDKVTGRVLFLDSGQGHEAWFAQTMPDWTAEKLKQFIEDTTQFTRVADLGADVDAVPPYHDNYGRHLFACIRD